MKKKNLFLLLINLTLVLIIIISFTLMNNKNPSIYKIEKGYVKFGFSKCKGHDSIRVGSPATAKWKCKICGVEDISYYDDVPLICHECEKITGRCSECGKLLNK